MQYQNFGPSQFKPSSILGSFLGDPPIIPEVAPEIIGASMCMMISSNTETIPETETISTKTEATNTNFLPYAISQTPFLYPPPGFV